jgi:hypothetical protein
MRPRRQRSAFACVLVGTASLAVAQIPPPVADAEFAQRKAHWAWQPLGEHDVPAGEANPVDAFVRAKLRAVGLEPSPPAPPAVQLRRLWFDLVGLPPTPAAVRRFLADPSEPAWAREVDELLASPHYAERQARHWLDLVRYAETLGHEYDFEIPNAWRYRDYVIRAMRDDVGHDQFVREHLAGDLLAAPRRDADGNDESVQATAAFWFVEQTHSPVDAAQHQADRIDNQIDVIGKAVLGLTVACARCHDHKFDAIRASDYYALSGFVQSSRYVQAPLRAVDVHGAGYTAALAAQRALTAAWADAARGEAWPAVRQSRAFARPAGKADAGEAPPAPDGGRTCEWNELPPLLELRPGERLVASADGRRGDWRVTNDGFGPAPWREPFCPDAASERPQVFVLPGAFWNSAVAGARREGVLATGTFTADARYVHVRVAGQGSRVIVVVDGLHVVRDPIYGELHRAVDDPTAHWVTFDLDAWRGRPVFVQAVDQRAHDLGDPRRERGAYPENGWIAVQSVLLSPHAEPPALPEAVPLPPAGWSEPPPPVRAALDALRAAVDLLPVSPTVPALADGTGRDEHVHLRGDHRRPGALAPRRFLRALAGDAPLATGPGSGRLQLADALLAADDPLPARVLVNRIWHHLFGRGLVKSVDNLGALGDLPSHPELLDWLARDAVAHGWSRKHVIRRIVTSACYRQSSAARGDARDVDPANVLLHRQNVRRLDAEAVRDALLAISGRLDATPFGPPIELPRDAHVEARGRPKRAGPLDGDGRRSIYLAVRRNFMPPMLLAFDLPTPFATVGARNVSNVPAQALALANDPFVHAQCVRWAERLQADATADLHARLTAAYELAFARRPDDAEVALCRSFLREHGESAWPHLLHALVNTTEFLYLR